MNLNLDLNKHTWKHLANLPEFEDMYLCNKITLLISNNTFNDYFNDSDIEDKLAACRTLEILNNGGMIEFASQLLESCHLTARGLAFVDTLKELLTLDLVHEISQQNAITPVQAISLISLHAESKINNPLETVTNNLAFEA